MASGVSSKIRASKGPENGGICRREGVVGAAAISWSRDHVSSSLSISSLLGAPGAVD